MCGENRLIERLWGFKESVYIWMLYWWNKYSSAYSFFQNGKKERNKIEIDSYIEVESFGFSFRFCL